MSASDAVFRIVLRKKVVKVERIQEMLYLQIF